MLVLSRRETERVIIANEICVQVVRIGAENVRIGIAAPMHIAIRRAEVRDRFVESNASATTQIPSAKMLDLLGRLQDMASTRGMTSEGLFEELMRQFPG
jgi:carbon storage regulator